MSKKQELTTARKAIMQDLYFFFGLTEDEIKQVESANPEQVVDKDGTPNTKQVERSISSTFRRSRR